MMATAILLLVYVFGAGFMLGQLTLVSANPPKGQSELFWWCAIAFAVALWPLFLLACIVLAYSAMDRWR